MPEIVGTLVVPKKAGATPTADGEIAYDTTADRLEYGDGSATKQVAHTDEVGGGGSGGGAATQRLAYAYAGADQSAVAITSGVWKDLIPDQSFLVGSADSVIDFALRHLIQVNAASTDRKSAVRLLIDGTTALEMGGVLTYATGQTYVPPGGSGTLQGLSSGSHTVRAQVLIDGANGSFWLRPSTGSEYLEIDVVELGPVQVAQLYAAAAIYAYDNFV